MSKVFAFCLLATFLIGCSSPASFKAAGVHTGKKYDLEVKMGKETFNPTLLVYVNGNQAMMIKRSNKFKDPNCAKSAVSSWVCTYSTSYDGKILKVVEEANATLASNSLYYDFYLDNDYVQRVVAAMY